MRVVFHSGGVFILLGWLVGGARKSILSDWAAGGKGWEKGKRRGAEGEGREREHAEIESIFKPYLC